MKYRVRNADGEMAFASKEEVQQAARTGMIEPTDELQAEGQTEWRRASDVTWLTTEVRRSPLAAVKAWGWVALSTGGAAVAFWLIVKGRQQRDFELLTVGVVVVIVIAVMLMRFTTRTRR